MFRHARLNQNFRYRNWWTKTLAGVVAVGCTMTISADCRAQNPQDEYRIAGSYYENGDWQDAANGFEMVIINYPDTEESTNARFFLAEAEMQVGNYRNAYNAFQSFVSARPNDELTPQAMFRMGEASYRLDQSSQAIRLFETFINDYPTHPLNEFALPHLGELRLARDEAQLAQRAFQTALEMFPESHLVPKCKLGIAKCLQLIGQNTQALKVYDEIAETSIDEISGNASLQMGILAFSNRKYSAARSSLAEAITRSNGDHESVAEANYWLARTEMAVGDSDAALLLFEEAIDRPLGPRLGEVILFDGAVAAIGHGNDHLAATWLDRLTTQYSSSQWADKATQLQIDLALKNSDYEGAYQLIDQFKQRFAGSSVEPNVLEAEGRVLYQRREYSASVGVFEKLLSRCSGRSAKNIASGRPTWIYLKSLGHLGLDEFAQAESMLNAINLSGQSVKLKTLVEIARATACYGQGKYGRAIPAYRNYLALEPDGIDAARARTELTISLARNGQWQETAVAFEHLRANHPDLPVVEETARFLAESAFSAGEYQHSEAWYKLLSASGDPADMGPRALSGLAWTQLRSGNTESAMENFEQLLKQFPETEFAQKAAVARAKHYDDSREFDKAAECYTFVIEKYPFTRPAYAAMLRRAYALQQLGGEQNLRLSKSLLNAYIRIPESRPDDENLLTLDEAIYQLGWVFKDLDDDAAGLQQFAVISESHPGSKYWPDAAFRVAQHHVQSRDHDRAELLFEQLVKKETPAEILTRVLYLQGRMAATASRWDSVTKSMNGLISSTDDPELHAKAVYWLAESLYRQDQFVASGEHFSRLLTETDNLSEDLQPWIHLRSAQCEVRRQMWNQALASAIFAKAKYGDFEAAYEFDFVRGRAYAALGKFDEARGAFSLVMESSTGSSSETAAMSAWHIGETYFHQDRHAKAIRAYRRVDALFDYPQWRAAALIQAGKCQEHLSNWNHAAKLYTQLINNFPESSFRQEAEERLALALRQASNVTQELPERIR